MPRPMRTWARASTLTEAGAHLLRRMRAWLPGRAGDGPAPQRQAAAGAADVIRQDERERVLAQARVHDMVSIQMRELMQGNLGKREGLRRQLTEQQATSELSAAWLRLRIEELDRLIAQQVATVDWHLRESRRLRQLSGAD